MPKSDKFYEEEGVKRHYYYVMDLRGQLFVESSVRTIATSMKDKKFLDFMYKNMKCNNSGIAPHIPYLTLCGKELNFVTPLDPHSPLVFKDLTAPSEPNKPYTLLYGGTLSQSFNPGMLAFCIENGRFYHQLLGHKHLSSPDRKVYGLLHVDITERYFSDNLVFGGEDREGQDVGEDAMRLRWKEQGDSIEKLYDVIPIP